MVKIKKVSIIHIISGDLWAGAEVQVYHTLNNLSQKKDISFTAILFNKGMLASRLTKIGIDCKIVDETKVSTLKMIQEMALIFKKANPKIIHVHASKEHVLGKIAIILSLKKIAIIRTVHGITATPQGLSVLRKIKSYTVHLIEYFLLRNTSIIAVSKDLSNFLSKRYPKSKISQIYNGILVKPVNLTNKNFTRLKYNIDENVYWICTAARLEKVKNLSMLIDTAEKLKKKPIKFAISIFGAGPLEKNLSHLIQSKNLDKFIKLHGFCNDMQSILNAADCFVMTSIHEGLPMSLLEALSSGISVVCTNVGGIREVLKNNKNGILVPSNNAINMCDALFHLYGDKEFAKKLSKNAINTIKEKFSIEITNKKLISTYNAILVIKR